MEELAVCRVLGELRQADRGRQLACLGIRSDGVSEADPREVSLTRSIATTHGRHGIRCNTVATGLVLTATAERNLDPASRYGRMQFWRFLGNGARPPGEATRDVPRCETVE